MGKRTKYILLSIVIIVIILFLWIIRPPSYYDRSKIDKRLTSLEEPFKSVETGIYMDGGSISIRIVDKNDVVLMIAIPVYGLDDPSYEAIYFGACHTQDLEEGAVEVKNFLETKLMIENILHRYSKSNPYIDQTLCALRGRVRDYIKVIYHNKMGHYRVE